MELQNIKELPDTTDVADVVFSVIFRTPHVPSTAYQAASKELQMSIGLRKM